MARPVWQPDTTVGVAAARRRQYRGTREHGTVSLPVHSAARIQYDDLKGELASMEFPRYPSACGSA